MEKEWHVEPFAHNELNDNFSVIRREVESFRLFQEDQLSDISESDNGTTLRKGVSISKVYWSGQQTNCYQLELGENKIYRRQDTNFINASKMIKLSSMTRGRKDAMLRSEKVRYTIKTDRIDFRGIWVPFERAKHLAKLTGVYGQVQDLFSYDMELVYQRQIQKTEQVG